MLRTMDFRDANEIAFSADLRAASQIYYVNSIRKPLETSILACKLHEPRRACQCWLRHISWMLNGCWSPICKI